MVGADRRLQLRIAVLHRLDQQRMLLVMLDFPLPAVYRTAGGENVDAGSQPPPDQQSGKLFGALRSGRLVTTSKLSMGSVRIQFAATAGTPS